MPFLLLDFAFIIRIWREMGSLSSRGKTAQHLDRLVIAIECSELRLQAMEERFVALSEEQDKALAAKEQLQLENRRLTEVSSACLSEPTSTLPSLRLTLNISV